MSPFLTIVHRVNNFLPELSSINWWDNLVSQMNTKPAVERSQHDGGGIEMQTFLGKKRKLRGVNSNEK
jgi:hypothetical protein